MAGRSFFKRAKYHAKMAREIREAQGEGSGIPIPKRTKSRSGGGANVDGKPKCNIHLDKLEDKDYIQNITEEYGLTEVAARVAMGAVLMAFNRSERKPWNIKVLCEMLGISRGAFYENMERYRVQIKSFVKAQIGDMYALAMPVIASVNIREAIRGSYHHARLIEEAHGELRADAAMRDTEAKTINLTVLQNIMAQQINYNGPEEKKDKMQELIEAGVVEVKDDNQP